MPEATAPSLLLYELRRRRVCFFGSLRDRRRHNELQREPRVELEKLLLMSKHMLAETKRHEANTCLFSRGACSLPLLPHARDTKQKIEPFKVKFRTFWSARDFFFFWRELNVLALVHRYY